MRFPNNENYQTGWQWASDFLSRGSVQDLKNQAIGVAQDLGEDESDADMIYEGIMDRAKSH